MLSRLRPGELRASLPTSPPEQAEPLPEILADVERQILPGITHWNHPSFFAYFSITSSAPGILGEMIAATLNVNGMLWRTSPAATELETVVLRMAEGPLTVADPREAVIPRRDPVGEGQESKATEERLTLRWLRFSGGSR